MLVGKQNLHLFLCALLVIAGVVVFPNDSRAQRPVFEGAVSAGSGLSFGKGAEQTVVLMTPAYLDIDVIYYNDEQPTFEKVIGFQAELQGRTSIGLIPQLRLTTGPAKFMWYGLVGAPVVFAPFVLAGIEAGGGFLFTFKKRFGVFAEAVSDLYFLGSDLPQTGVLVQLDINIGMRLGF